MAGIYPGSGRTFCDGCPLPYDFSEVGSKFRLQMSKQRIEPNQLIFFRDKRFQSCPPIDVRLGTKKNGLLYAVL